MGGSKITILVMGKTMGKLSKVQNHNKQTDESRKYYFYEFQPSNITALFMTGYSKKVLAELFIRFLKVFIVVLFRKGA